MAKPTDPSRSRSQYLEAPPYNSDGSDDAGSRQGTLQDMDLHCFHPVFFTTPRGRYAIPRYAGNFGFAETTSIDARPVTAPGQGTMAFALSVVARGGKVASPA